SPQFKLYLLKEFQRLKEEEQKTLGWSAKRELAKINYHIHTNANCLNRDFSKINLISLIIKIMSIIKIPKIKVQTTNMENLNAVFINEGLPQRERLIKLNQVAIQQMNVLHDVENRKLLK
ncbi:MAG: KilA-N domain-containing protein, partial [Prevotellaceae bacterium]|nr:KilA-N domain-containing protein [Prevotellaceae bacterium]